MDRTTAFELVKSRISNKNLRKHIIAVEAVMTAMAAKFGESVENWALAGLLHDLDYEETLKDPARHALVTAELLAATDVPQDIIDAIKAHADKKPRETKMEKAIYCADPVTGFLVACALIRPEKKLAAVNVEFAKSRMKEKRFAAGADRNRINACSDLGLSIEEFMELSLQAMQNISAELEL